MTFVKINYTDLYDLICKFQNTDFSNVFHNKNSNFVIVNKTSYQGSYGGIYHKTELETFTHPFIYGSINSSYVLVWWQISCSSFGDLSLSKSSFAVVTPDMYSKMKKSNIYKAAKSSYY